jgi:DNA-binding CsgD family transcriptional regulator
VVISHGELPNAVNAKFAEKSFHALRCIRRSVPLSAATIVAVHMTEDHTNRRDPHHERRPAPLLGRGALIAALIWGLAVLAVTAGIAGSTALWPLVPLFGAAVPVLLLVLQERARREVLRGQRVHAVLASDVQAESEVLRVLGEEGRLTPTGVALRTSLTVSQASDVLGRLAGRGHLEVSAEEETLTYSLREGDRPVLEGQENPPGDSGTDEAPAGVGPPIESLEEPLSGRELEVLALLASGKTNREVAGELYVAEGTVKAHVASIYRKLGVRNRAAMLNRARALGLLGNHRPE